MAESTAQTYRDAAKEHLGRADQLFADEQYFLAHFVAGLAVECHLRAYLRRVTKEFDSKHDLNKLAKESRFYDIVPEKRVEDFSAKLPVECTMAQQPPLLLRTPISRLYERAERDGAGRYPGARRQMENLCRTVVNVAHEIINQGEAKWNS